MKKRCIHCGKYYDESLDVCPKCSKNNMTENMSIEDVHHLHQEAHNHITEEINRFNSGMVRLVTGAILLILGVSFLFLSFKYNIKKERIFTPLSVEFIVACICLGVSTFLLTWGTIFVIQSQTRKKFFNHIIDTVQIEKKETPVEKEDTIAVKRE